MGRNFRENNNSCSWKYVTQRRYPHRNFSRKQNLYWDYYYYVKENPITNWNVSTYILYGEKDNLCEKNIVMNFAEKFNCNIFISNESEHWFHTESDLKILKNWFEKIL